jgi:hypothetical protein
MVTSLDAELVKIETCRKNLDKFLKDAIMQEIEYIVQLNIKQHISRGVLSTGASMGAYAESTKRQKRRKGQPYDHIYLEDTGTFHNHFEVTFLPDRFKIDDVTTDYAKWIIHRYGEDVYGLTKENIALLQKQVIPVVVSKIKASLS